MGTGLNQTYYTTFQDFWEYDPVADTWTIKASLPEGSRYDAVGFSIGSRGYIGMGYLVTDSAVFYKDFWEYDPSTDAWTQKTDFGNTARQAAVGFTIAGKGYVGTGWDGSSYTKDFWEYDSGLDMVPDQFTFTDQTDVELSETVVSNTITVTGITSATPIPITGGTYSINNGAYTSADGVVNNNDTVTVQLNSSGSYSSTTSAILTIGGVSDTFSVTTMEEGSTNCFIATAAFGSPMAKQVNLLRQFRDEYLMTHAFGRTFVSWYYRNGPVAANYIRNNPLAKAAVRIALYPLIGFSFLLISGYLSFAMGGLFVFSLCLFRPRPRKSSDT